VTYSGSPSLPLQPDNRFRFADLDKFHVGKLILRQGGAEGAADLDASGSYGAELHNHVHWHPRVAPQPRVQVSLLNVMLLSGIGRLLVR